MTLKNNEEEYKAQLASINLFTDNILASMNKITKSTTKSDMLAYMDAWKTELQTIKFIIGLDE